MPLSCGETNVLVSPVVRIDLRHTLGEAVGRALETAEEQKSDAARTCTTTFDMQAGPASQTFEATWRVFDFGGKVHITALELSPKGPTVGGTNPEAGASAGEVTYVPQKGKSVASVQLSVTYAAQSGCHKAEAHKKVTLTGTGPGCPKPKPKVKLLVPVK